MLVRRCSLFFALLLSLSLAVPAFGQYGYHFGRNKIQYEDFDWHVLKTEHFDVFYYPEMRELAEQGAHFAEEVYDELEHRFATSLGRRVPIIFYSSNIHFKQTNITPGFIPDGVGGFFEFLKGRVVIPANGDIHRFRRVVRHELVHVFTHAKVLRVLRDHRQAPDRFLPLWFTEGLAEYWSGEPDYRHEMIMRDAVFSNYLVPLENLGRIRGTYLMYKEGEAICRFIAETYGEEKILELMENFWKDKDFRVVMEVTLHEDFMDVAQRWQAWLKAQYYPMLDEVELPTLLAEGLSVEGFNSKPAFYEFEDGTRRVYLMGNRSSYTNVYQVTLDSLYQPTGRPEVLVKGERSDRFEAFHLFESRLGISPDGKLAFVTKSGEQDVIHVYDLEKDEMGATYRFDKLIAVYSPAWSPDGKKLVFSSIDRSGFSDLYTYDTAKDQLHRLTDDAYDDRDPSWSPDGRRIAFSSSRTSVGEKDAYNLFTYRLEDGAIDYVTFGEQHDLSPSWSPSGERLVFISTRPDSSGRYGAQNLWVADMTSDVRGAEPEVVASRNGMPSAMTLEAEALEAGPYLKRLTNLTAAAFDPVWVGEDALAFTAFEHYRFTVRAMDGIDSLVAAPKEEKRVTYEGTGEHWAFARLGASVEDSVQRVPYRRKYNLDFAAAQGSTNPIWGASGGAVLAFSDMMGDDYWYVTAYNTGQGRQDFLESMNVSVTRVHLGQRTNTAYGLYRYGGLRYDITDPIANETSNFYPRYYETMYGGFGSISYPLSMFRRIDLSTSLAWSDKTVPGVIDVENGGLFRRKAVLLSNAVSLVHDNSLYGMNGPMQGWRGNLTAAYTTDVLYSNVSYVTLSADVRHYQKIIPGVTLASWAMGRVNSGKEARLFILGGSWDLRGQRLFSIRGQKMWFTSHELRFPILNAPSLYLPILAPFGVANLRGAFFFDAAHAWNDDYYQRRRELGTGETLGAAGLGFRLNLFGGFVLRYDLGFEYRDGFRHRERFFKQFFFGWDF